MKTNQSDKQYLITFVDQQPMKVVRENIQSPTLLKAIDFIDAEPSCLGIRLSNGINIQLTNQ